MPTESSTDPLPPAPAGRGQYAEQDQQIENDITEIGQRIQAAQSNAELAALLAGRGYDAEALQAGLNLQAAAQAAFTTRQTALGAKGLASAAHSGAYLTAYQMYADFRETARAVFTASGDRSTLSINGPIPKDNQKFITLARASYSAAQHDPYKTTLAKYGYPAAGLAAALDALNAYTTAIQSHTDGQGDAKKATADRNAAYTALVTWDKQFRKIAKVAVRTRPDLAKKLNL
jgi:hypothetical protein